MKAQNVGQAGLQGWRRKVADAVATPVAKRSSKASEDDIRAAIGALFLALTIMYVVQALKEVLADS